MMKLITNSFNNTFVNKTIGLKIDLNKYRVKFNPNVLVAIACYNEYSILKILGFGAQSTVFEIPQNVLSSL